MRPARSAFGAVLVTIMAMTALGACDGQVGGARPLPVVAPGAVATPEPRMTRTDPIRIVIVGDSLTLPVPDCVAAAPRRVAPCATLEEALARHLTDWTGRSVVRDNLSLAGGDVDGVLRGLTSDDRERVVGAADLVVVSVGMQSQTGWLDAACTGEARAGEHERADDLEGPEPPARACLDASAAFDRRYRSRLDRIYATIQRLVSDHPAVLVDLGVFNGLVERPELTSLWAAADCALARDHGFDCVDLQHVFNGPGGREPASDYASWFAGSPRLTWAGVATVARLVRSLDLSALR